ncbi:MAG: hypothetical protein R2748_31660 [Bryobacterales bacterium]
MIDDVELHGFNPQNSTIAVHNPPVTGAHTGDNLYVEVTVDYRVPTTFMRSSDPTIRRSRHGR